jgi:hypothetical protein
MQLDRVPRKYHLRWDSNLKAIVIQVHRDCLRFVKNIPRKAPLIENVIQTHKLDTLFDSFSGDLSGDSFGFNHALRKMRDDGEYIEFIVSLPEIKIQTPLVCQDCAGTGKGIDGCREGEKCLYCVGEGMRHAHNWRSAYAVTSSLGLLFMILDVGEDTSAKEFQDVTISMTAQHGQHGSSIEGCFGIDFLDYVSSNPFELKNIILENTVDAMSAASRKMFLDASAHARCTIRIDCNSSSIGFTVPGDACGISTDFYGRRPGEGRRFTCHNMDSPLQSLTLLAGLASFVGQASFYIYNKRENLVLS